MRIGLANVPLLLALDIFGLKHFFLLALLKVLGRESSAALFFHMFFCFPLPEHFHPPQ